MTIEQIHSGLQDVPFRAIIAGKTKSGKTFLLKVLIKDSKYHKIYWIGPTGRLQGISHKKVEIIQNYSADLIDDIRQESENAPEHQFLLIFDDNGSTLRHKTEFTKFYNNLRHHKNISCIIAVQKLTQIPPELRENSDYLIFFRPGNKKEISYIQDEFLRGNKQLMEELMKLFRNEDFLYIKIYRVLGGKEVFTAEKVINGKIQAKHLEMDK